MVFFSFLFFLKSLQKCKKIHFSAFSSHVGEKSTKKAFSKWCKQLGGAGRGIHLAGKPSLCGLQDGAVGPMMGGGGGGVEEEEEVRALFPSRRKSLHP